MHHILELLCKPTLGIEVSFCTNKLEFYFDVCSSYPPKNMATLATGYGPSRRLLFDGDEAKYELWKIKFLGYMRLHKLYDVILAENEPEEENVSKNIDAFGQLIQCLDDRSLSLVMGNAKDDGRKALQILTNHYMGKSKPRVLARYTELTSLQKGHD